MRFQSEPTFSNFFGVEWTGPKSAPLLNFVKKVIKCKESLMCAVLLSSNRDDCPV